jgi:hypothetical protein
MQELPNALSEAEEELARKFPGLVTLDRRRIRRIGLGDKYSLLYGELWRWRTMFRHLDKQSRDADFLKVKGDDKRRLMQKVLFNFYVGDPLAPYDLEPGDFQTSIDLLQTSLRDVEEMYDYFMAFLPRQIDFRGDRLDLHRMLQVPEEVRTERDPVELIRLSRFGGRGHSPWVSHSARMKLVIGQLCFEYRRHGFDPAQMHGRSEKTRMALEDRLFVRGSLKRVRVLAELDVAQAYACHAYHIIEDSHVAIPDRDDAFVTEADQYLVECEGKQIPVLFSIRPKRFPALKSLVRDIRFPQLANIGDGVAMRCVVHNEADLDRLVSRFRETFVFRPGTVSDQESTLGDGNGRRRSNRNRHTGSSFKVMMHNVLIRDQVNEVQFAPVPNYVDGKCRHDDGHHGSYKLRQLTVEVLPYVYPSMLTRVPWPTHFVTKDDVTLPQANLETWYQFVAHVRAHDNKGKF